MGAVTRWLAVGLGAATLVACGSGGSSDLPLGDDLDDLLNFVSAPGLHEELVRDCVEAQGARYELPEAPPPSPPAEAALSSGIVVAEIARLQTDEPARPPIPDDLARALHDPVTFAGQTWEHGCAMYADVTAADTQSEKDRELLRQRYIDDVGLRMMTDPRWTAIDRGWAICMSGRGFPGLDKPGAQIDLIVAEVEAANGDLALLDEALRYDERVTRAVIECLAEDGRQQRRRDIRRDYEERFVREHRADIEALVLAVEEAASSSPATG